MGRSPESQVAQTDGPLYLKVRNSSKIAHNYQPLVFQVDRVFWGLLRPKGLLVLMV